MNRSERRRTHDRPTLLPALLTLLAVATGSIAQAQASGARDASSRVDTWYADYAAMSAAPTGPAMDRWLAGYAPHVFFEDPTLGQGAIGRDTIRALSVDAFTGPMGPVRWDIRRRVTSGEWTAVEGWLEGTQRERPFRTRFSTWLLIRDGQIVHQIDYIDYAALRRQVAGTDPVPAAPADPAPAPDRPDAAHALRVADEFYRRYEAMPVLASAAGVARYTELLTDDFRLEDPTAAARIDGRARYERQLRALLETGDYGPLHWVIERRLTDGEWVAVEGSARGTFKGRPYGMRFTTWLRVRGDRIAQQIDYVDYETFRRQTSPR